MIEDKDKKIAELESLVVQERIVKESEVLLNKDLLIKIKKLELHNDTLLSINEEYSQKIAQLKVLLDKLK
jgi:hypothetical protein